jgi:hypothetical protein
MLPASASVPGPTCKVESQPPWPEVRGSLLFALATCPIALVVSASYKSGRTVRL